MLPCSLPACALLAAVAFRNAHDAMCFCARFQLDLLLLPWPHELLATSACTPVWMARMWVAGACMRVWPAGAVPPPRCCQCRAPNGSYIGSGS